MPESKARAMLGFAVKANKIIYGTDYILTLRTPKYLILYDADLSPNAAGKLNRYASLNGIPVKITDNPLSGLLNRPNVKAVALTDKEMAKGILQNPEP